ncbi:MAG: cation:proton antiporter [Rhodovibrionaceae bacterium]|nr:cation:proton antiporter [Rhodovibrionaceae bacterium]
MHEQLELTAIAIVVVAALAGGMVMARLSQPAVVGYILAGALLGPSGLGLVENRENIQVLAELGVLMLLFLIGMELSLRGFREVWKIAIGTTLLQIGVGVGVMLGLGQLFGWSLPLSLVVGFTFALSSTAVAVKMLEEIGELRSRAGQLTVGILIAQDLAVVPMMLIIGAFEGADTEGADVVVTALVKVTISIAVLIALILFLWRRQRVRLPFERLVGDHVDLTPLAGLVFCFGAATISGLLGMSAAYGAFLAGLVIGNSTARATMMHHTHPIQSVLLMAFFLSIGLLVDLAYVWENIVPVVVLLIFVAIFKTIFNVTVLHLLGESWSRAFLAGTLLAQLGEFSFLLAAVGLSAGIVSDGDYRLIVSVTVLSLIFAPFWLASARRLNRIALLGITSAREILRLAYGAEIRVVRRGLRQAGQDAERLRNRFIRLPDLSPRRIGGGKNVRGAGGEARKRQPGDEQPGEASE